MLNTILTPSIIAREALMVLRNNAVMANLVHRNYSDEFAAVGDTITIRKPATFAAKEFTDKIEVQGATESGVKVVMDKLLDVSFKVTAKEMALDIADFSAQFLIPAMQAFNDQVDKYLLALEKELTNRVALADGDAFTDKIVDARKHLTANAVPLTDRRFVYGANTEADLLKTDLFINASAVGDEGTALREASLGRKYGMDFYVDQNVARVEATTPYTPSIAFHKNAFALVTRPLALPKGAKDAAIINYDGFGLRVVYGYDMETKTDIVSIDMLCGVAMLNDKLAAVIDDTRDR